MRYVSGYLLLLFAASTLFAQLTPVNLGDWTHEGLLENGNWTISEDSTSVRQSVNDEPTFFVSPDTFANVTIRGSFFVDGGDDDYIGFVFGYFRPVGEEEYFDFYLLDWKGATQSGAQEGFTLSKVEGIVDVGSGTNTSHPYWDHEDTTQTVLGTYYGDYGWARNVEYEFELIYESNRVRITIDTTQIFDIEGEFRPGRFGFYNYSQPGVNYQEFRVNEAPIAVNDTFMTPEDSLLAMDVTENDIDEDGHDKIITEVSEAANGTIGFTPGDTLIYYTPDANFFGMDSVTYHISDGNGGVDSAKAVITVLSVNDPPVRVAMMPDSSIKENSSEVFFALINDYFSDVDVNDAFLEDISVMSNGDVTSKISLDSLFLSSQNFVGFDTLIVSVADDSGAVASDTFAVEVLNQNTPPFVVQALPDTTINNDSQNIFFRELNDVFSDLDANDVPLDSFHVQSRGLVLTALEGDSLYLTASGEVGVDTLTVTAVDDSNAASSDTFVVNVLDATALEDLAIPLQYNLSQNYPNPFNPLTVIEYSVPRSADVEISVYNLAGQNVITLIRKNHAPGNYKVTWNASGQASGVYIYRIKAEGFVQSRKMLLIR